MGDGPPAESIPQPTVTLACGAPGCGLPFEWTPRGGRKPKYGPCHKRAASVERSELAYGHRKKIAEHIDKQERETRQATQCARLAAGLRITDDPLQAAMMFGVDARGEELTQLAARARAQHEQLIAGDMRDTAHLAESTIHVLLLESIERRGSFSPRDLAMLMRFGLDVRQAFIGEGAQANYTSIVLVAEPPRPLTDDERARVRGKAIKEAADKEE